MRDFALETAKGQALTDAIRLVCPLDGISIGKWDDRKTWSIQFKPEATAEQKAAGEKVLAELDLSGVIAPKTAEEKVADLEKRLAALEGKVK